MIHPREAFESRVEDRGDCWVWKGKIHQAGYGVFVWGGTSMLAHRQAWEWWNGMTVPEGLVVRHSCDVRICVNPHHLLIGTRAENSADMVARGRSTRKDVCFRGHAMEGNNLMERVVTRTVRNCRKCHNIRVRKYGATQRALR